MIVLVKFFESQSIFFSTLSQTFCFLKIIFCIFYGTAYRVLSTPQGMFTPHIWRHPSGYTLPAPPLAGSPCIHWHKLYIAKRNAFRISGVTFEVSICTKFQILRPDPAGGSLQCSPRLSSWWQGDSLSPPQNHNPALWSRAKLRPLPVTHTPSS